MKLMEGIAVTELDDSIFAVPTGPASERYRGIIRLNETGGMILNCLMKGMEVEQIADRILSEYKNVTRETAEKAVQDVVNKLRSVGLIEEQ